MEPRGRIVAVLTAISLGLMGVGVAAIVFDTGFAGAGQPRQSGLNSGTTGDGSPSARPSSTPGATSTGSGNPRTPEPSISASPSVSAGPTQRPAGFRAYQNGFAYFGDDGSITPVVPIADLEVRLQSGKAVYYALPSNRYLLKAGSYAGEFIPLVTMAQANGSSAQTGGIVLAGPVVTKMISEKMASIKLDAQRWIVALPVDIRSAKTSVDVTFDQFGLAGLSNAPRVVVRFGGSLPVVEAVPTNGGFHVLIEGLGVTAWQVIDPLRLTLPAGAIDPAHAMNQLLIYGSGTPSIHKDVRFDGRAAMGSVMFSTTSEISVSLVAKGTSADLGPDKILTVGDVPVFVASN